MGITKQFFMEMRASQDYISEKHIIASDKREQILKLASELTSLTNETRKLVDELKKNQSNGKRD